MNRALFELQEIDLRIMTLRRERAHLDEGGTARAARDTARTEVASLEHRLAELDRNRRDQEQQLADTESQIKKQQSRLMTATSAHDVSSLEKGIAALQHHRSDLDENILVLMDDMETVGATLAGERLVLAEREEAVTQVETHFSAESARLDNLLQAAQDERQTVAGQLSEEESELYTESAAHHHGIALVHPEKGSCSVCGMEITMFTLREAKQREFPTCESCGRLLYVE